MLSPKGAARRIQTIVYERLLETDIDLVFSIITVRTQLQKQSNLDEDDNVYDDIDKANNHHDHDHDHDHWKCNIFDESMKVIGRIIRLIETIQPIVVIED